MLHSPLDSVLIAEGAKMELQLGFVRGGDVQAVVQRLYQSPPGVMVRAGDRLGESAGQVDLRAARGASCASATRRRTRATSIQRLPCSYP
jgi:hypothetical protein